MCEKKGLLTAGNEPESPRVVDRNADHSATCRFNFKN